MVVRVSILGPMEIQVSGRGVVPLPGQLTGVLASLALVRGPIDKSELARSVLFISPRTIDSRLSRLRNVLGLPRPLHRVTEPRSGRIELDRSMVEVDADAFVDLVGEAEAARSRDDEVRACQLLREADELWRGPPGLATGQVTEAADNIVARAIERILATRRSMCAGAAELMIEGALAPDEARLARWTRESPDNDVVWFARTLLALERHGHGDARHVLDAWDVAAPDDHVAVRGIREWAGRSVETLGATRKIVRANSRSCSDVSRSIRPVGREDAAEQIEDWLDEVDGGGASTVLVTGSSGTGKTYLLDYAARLAEVRGSRVLAADAEELSGTHTIVGALLAPVWEQLLRRPQPPRELEARADAIAQLVGGTFEPSPLRDREPVDALGGAIDLTCELLRYVSEDEAVVIAIDNLHRGGAEFEAMLDALYAARLPRVGFLMTSRDDRTSWHRPFLTDATRIRLGPFDIATTARFLAAVRGCELESTEAAVLSLNGNATPLALLHADLSLEGIEQAAHVDNGVSLELQALAIEQRRALGVAAVTAEGRTIDVDLTVALAPDVEPALAREIERGHILARDEAGVAFTHRSWQEAAYSALDPLERRHLHGRAVELLDQQIEATPRSIELGSLAVRLAHHAGGSDLSATPRARAIHALTRAATVVGPLDTEYAVDLFEHALDLAADQRERVGLLMERARLRWAAADWDGAEKDLAAVVNETATTNDAILSAEALLLTARLTWDPSRAGGSLAERLVRVLRQLPPSERILRARVQACLAGGLYQDGASAGAVDGPGLATAALETIESLGAGSDPSLESEVVWWARKGLLDVASPDSLACLSERLRSLAGRSHHLRGNALLASCVDDLVRGRLSVARRWSDDYRELATATDSPLHRYVAATLDGLWGLHDGRYDEVAAATAEAEQIGSAFGGVTVTQVVEGQRIIAARDLGSFRQDPKLVEVVEALSPVDGPIPIWGAAGAWLRAEIGDYDVALARLESIAEATDDLRAVPAGAHRLPFLAFVADTLERLQSFGASTPRSRALAGNTYRALQEHPAQGVLLGWPVAYLGPKDHFLGLAAAASGDDALAIEHLAAARRRSPAGAPTNIRSQLAMGFALARSGERDTARRAATRSARRAESIRMAGVLEDTITLLRWSPSVSHPER